MTDALNAMSAMIDSAGLGAVRETLKHLLQKHFRVVFNGNNYSAEWRQEASERGLPALKNAPMALEAFLSEKNRELFAKTGVLSPEEHSARGLAYLELYVKQIEIEARTAVEMARTMIIPAAIKYQGEVSRSIGATNAVSGEKTLRQATLLNRINSAIENTIAAIEAVDEKSKLCHSSNLIVAAKDTSTLVPLLDEMRKQVDLLEVMVDDHVWPLPKYRELLHVR